MIPRFSICGYTFCDRAGEAEGWTVEFRWFRFVAIIAFARFDKA